MNFIQPLNILTFVILFRKHLYSPCSAFAKMLASKQANTVKELDEDHAMSAA